MQPVCALLVLFFCWFGISGCNGSGAMKSAPPSGQAASEASQPSADHPADTFTITGTVVYLNLEGGVYVIRGDGGRTYNPSNLPEKYQKDGLPTPSGKFAPGSRNSSTNSKRVPQ